MIRNSHNGRKSKARQARIRAKAIEFRERVKQSTLAFLERRERHLAWWQRAFRTPAVGFYNWAKTYCSSVWAAMTWILGFTSQTRLLRRASSVRKSKSYRQSLMRRRLRVEGLEQRQLLAVDTLSATLSGGNLTLADIDVTSKDNVLTIVRSGADLVISDANESFAAAPAGGTLSNSNKTLTIPFASVPGALVFNTAGGNDTLTLDLSGGDAVPNAFLFNGGSPTSGPGDKLVIAGGSQGTVTYNYTNANDGSVAMSNFGTVTYTGLEPITNSGTADNIVFNLPAGPSAVILEDDGTSANTISRLRSSPITFETTDFANPTNSLTINRGNASDTLMVNALPDFNRHLTIGSQFTPLDSVTFQGNVTLASGFSLTANAGTLTSTNALTTSGGGSVTLRSLGNITLMGASSSIVTNGGTFTAQADFDNSGAGSFSIDNAAGLASTNNGQVFVTAADVALDGALNANGGTVNLLPSANRPINLGGSVAGSLSLSDAELNLITAGTMNIGDATSGTITVGGAVNSPGAGTGAHLNLTTGGNVAVNNSLTLTVDRNLNINAPSGASSVTIGAAVGTTGTGNISVMGKELTVTGVASVATVAQPVSLTADRMNLGGPVSATTSTVTLKQRNNTGAVGIDLGSATDAALNTLELSAAEMGQVTAGTLNLGDGNTGPIVVSAAIIRSSMTTMTLSSANTINSPLARSTRLAATCRSTAPVSAQGTWGSAAST